MRRSSSSTSTVFPALLDIYLSGSLADVALVAGGDDESDKTPIRAHKAVLAASSGYFRALFAGAAATMMMRTTEEGEAEEQSCSSAPSDSLPTVRLPSLTRGQLEAVLEWVYSCGERAAFQGRGRGRGGRRRGAGQGRGAKAGEATTATITETTTTAEEEGEDEEEDEAAEDASSTAAAGAALAAADFLDVPRLRAAALSALRSRLTPRTALQALALSASCGDCGHLYGASLAMAQARFSEVVVAAAAGANAAARARRAAASDDASSTSSSPDATPSRSIGSLFAPSPPPTPPPPGFTSSVTSLAAAAASALASLPPHALLDLLRGDALDARDEAEVLSVAMGWCDASEAEVETASCERLAWVKELLSCCRAPAVELAASERVLALLHPERLKEGKANPTSSSSSSFPCFVFSKGTREAFADALAEAAAGPSWPPPAPRGFGIGIGTGAATGGAATGGGAAGFLQRGGPFLSGRALVACGGHDDGWRPFRTTEIYDPVVDEWAPGPTAPAPLPFAAAAIPDPLWSSSSGRLGGGGSLGGGGGRAFVVAGAAMRATALLLESAAAAAASNAAAAASAAASDAAVAASRARRHSSTYSQRRRSTGGEWGDGGNSNNGANDENRLSSSFSSSLFAPAAPPAPPPPALLSPAKQRLLLPRWRHMPAPLTPRIHAAAASLGGELFVIGGRPGVGPELSTVEVWSPNRDIEDDEEEFEFGDEDEEEGYNRELWRRGGGTGRRNSTGSSSAIAALAAAASNRSSSSSNPSTSSSSAGGSWSRAPSLTTPRTAASAASLAGRIYVIGGQTGARTHGGAEVFDAAGGGRWVKLGGGGGSGSGSGHASNPSTASSFSASLSFTSPSPLSSQPDPGSQLATPRKYATAVAWGGRVVVLGGTDALRVRLASAEALDPREGKWRALPPMRTARSGAGAAVSASAGGLLVVAGGTPGGGDGAVDAVEALSPAGVGLGGGSGIGIGDGRNQRSCWEQRAPLGAPRAGLALLPV